MNLDLGSAHLSKILHSANSSGLKSLYSVPKKAFFSSESLRLVVRDRIRLGWRAFLSHYIIRWYISYDDRCRRVQQQQMPPVWRVSKLEG